MNLEIKPIKIDIIFHKIMDGIVEEISIEGNVYKLMKSDPASETKIAMEEPGHYKPEDGVEFNESYRVWITQKDIDRVILALNHVEFDYKRNMKSIQRQSKMPLLKCKATLNYLCRIGKVTKKRDQRKDMIYTLMD